MPFTIRKLPPAETEAAGAAIWYEKQRPGLGFDFLDRVDEAVGIIRENPLRYAIVSETCVERQYADSNLTAFTIS